MRTQDARGALPHGARSAIITIPNPAHVVALRLHAARLGIVVDRRAIVNVDVVFNCDGIGLWTGGKVASSKLKLAGSLNHCQLRFPITELFRSKVFSVPWILNAGDDQFRDLWPHLNTKLPSGATVLEALEQICDAPYSLPVGWCPLGVSGCEAGGEAGSGASGEAGGEADGEAGGGAGGTGSALLGAGLFGVGLLVTFCGKWTPDMKAAFSSNGRDMKPTKGGARGRYDPVEDTTNEMMAKIPPPLLDSDGFRNPGLCSRAKPWQWADVEEKGKVLAGLATKGLFAQSLYELLSFQPAMKLALSYPGVEEMKRIAAELDALAKRMLAPLDRDATSNVLRRAAQVTDELTPLLKPATFPTKLKDGSILTIAAVTLGRVIGKRKEISSGCSTLG